MLYVSSVDIFRAPGIVSMGASQILRRPYSSRLRVEQRVGSTVTRARYRASAAI